MSIIILIIYLIISIVIKHMGLFQSYISHIELAMLFSISFSWCITTYYNMLLIKRETTDIPSHEYFLSMGLILNVYTLLSIFLFRVALTPHKVMSYVDFIGTGP